MSDIEGLEKLAKLLDPRKPTTALSLAFPGLLAICTALSVPDPLRAHLESPSSRDWALLIAHYLAWVIVVAAIVLGLSSYRKRKRAARIAARRTRIRTVMTDIGIELGVEEQLPPGVFDYSKLDEQEANVIKVFIDRGLQTLGNRAFANSDQSIAVHNTWALQRLQHRQFVFARGDVDVSWTLADRHFRYLSEHPDEIHSSSPPRYFA